MSQRVASLELGARQPRLAMEADVPADEKSCERTKGVAKVVQAMHGDSLSAKRVQDDRTTSTSFGVKAESPALPCRDDVLVENGAAAPKPCLSPLEMRATVVAGGLLPTDKASTATRTIFDQPTFWLCRTEEKKMRTSVLYAWYYSSFWMNNLLAAPSCRRVIETKSRQNRMFDLGGFTGRLRACSFRGKWRALLYGEVLRLGAGWYPRLQWFLEVG